MAGFLPQSDSPAEPARLTVDVLEVLATAPARAPMPGHTPENPAQLWNAG
ncbi:hypothetical protein ACFYO2_43655 [Streptomyces sp. NPDC006602]